MISTPTTLFCVISVSYHLKLPVSIRKNTTVIMFYQLSYTIFFSGHMLSNVTYYLELHKAIFVYGTSHFFLPAKVELFVWTFIEH